MHGCKWYWKWRQLNELKLRSPCEVRNKMEAHGLRRLAVLMLSKAVLEDVLDTFHNLSAFNICVENFAGCLKAKRARWKNHRQSGPALWHNWVVQSHSELHRSMWVLNPGIFVDMSILVDDSPPFCCCLCQLVLSKKKWVLSQTISEDSEGNRSNSSSQSSQVQKPETFDQMVQRMRGTWDQRLKVLEGDSWRREGSVLLNLRF